MSAIAEAMTTTMSTTKNVCNVSIAEIFLRMGESCSFVFCFFLSGLDNLGYFHSFSV